MPPAGSSDEEGAENEEEGFDLVKVQSHVVESINSGYLESVKSLREGLMVQEWELNLKRWSQRRWGKVQWLHHMLQVICSMTAHMTACTYICPVHTMCSCVMGGGVACFS